MSRQSVILIGVGCLLLLVAAYTLGGVLQAASLFVSARALSNANLWGSISLVAFLGALICFSRVPKNVAATTSARMVVAAVAALLAVALAWPLAAEFMAVDACLDGGGSYDYVRSVCDSQQNHPYLPLFHRQGFRVVASLALIVFAALVLSPSWRELRGRRSAL